MGIKAEQHMTQAHFITTTFFLLIIPQTLGINLTVDFNRRKEKSTPKQDILLSGTRLEGGALQSAGSRQDLLNFQEAQDKFKIRILKAFNY